MQAILLLILSVINQSGEKIVIDITSPKYRPVNIQIQNVGKVSDAIMKNLSIIGYFNVVNKDPDVFVKIERKEGVFIFRGEFKDNSPFFEVEVKAGDEARIADAFSNYIIQKVAGVKAELFGNNLFFLSNIDGKKEIYVSDFPPSSYQKVVSAKSFIPSFAVSPKGDKIAFVHYDGESYRLYITDTRTKKIYTPNIFNVVSILSPFFLSENILIISMNKGDGSQIYAMDIKNSSLRKISYGEADVSAKVTPDGKKLVLTSGRDGLPQIYIRDISSGSERKLPLSGRYNSSPDVSPTRNEIVFTKLEGTRFNIYIYNLDDNQEMPLITNFGSSENPIWSPDGNFIIFSSNYDGDYDLYITDRFGTFKKKILDTKKDEFIGFLSPK